MKLNDLRTGDVVKIRSRVPYIVFVIDDNNMLMRNVNTGLYVPLKENREWGPYYREDLTCNVDESSDIISIYRTDRFSLIGSEHSEQSELIFDRTVNFSKFDV